MKLDVSFGLNSFGKPNVSSAKDSAAQMIINLLYLRPGQIPSMPHIGINISQYLYNIDENTDLSNLREAIAYQAASLLPTVSIHGVTVGFVNYESRDTIVIIIPMSVDSSAETLLIGASKSDDDGRVIFRYEFDESII